MGWYSLSANSTSHNSILNRWLAKPPPYKAGARQSSRVSNACYKKKRIEKDHMKWLIKVHGPWFFLYFTFKFDILCSLSIALGILCGGFQQNNIFPRSCWENPVSDTQSLIDHTVCCLFSIVKSLLRDKAKEYKPRIEQTNKWTPLISVF